MEHRVIGPKKPAIGDAVNVISVSHPDKGTVYLLRDGHLQDVPGQVNQLQHKKGDEWDGSTIKL